jgi:hypothetical protein
MAYTKPIARFSQLSQEDSMEKAVAWLRDTPNLREDVIRSLQYDGLLDDDSLPDALAAEPMLLSKMAKELVILAIKQDAPEGVAEELLSAMRVITNGAKEVGRSAYLSEVLRSLRGLRDAYELEPVLKKALAGASDDADRSKIRNMLDTLSKTASDGTLDEEFLPPDGTGTELSPHCVPCCYIGCVVCLRACILCCLIGCAVCSK